jgi:hypothetical protein
MLKRLTLLAALAASGLMLGGCTKCGWIWNEGQPASCRDDFQKPAAVMPLLAALDL